MPEKGMPLFSRLFRRQPPAPAPQPEQAPPPDPAALAAQRAAEEEEALTAAIAAADQAALASLACTGFSTRIRQRAAQAIDDPARLHELIRATRGGKDKQVYRILTAKRDEVLAEQRSAERLEAEIQAASAAIERHSLRPFDALFTPTLEQLERRWSAVASRSAPELQQHVERHLGRARETIEQYRKRLEAEAARERAAARAADEERTRRELERQAEETAAAEQARAREAERLAQLERQRAEEAALRTIVSLVRKALAALDQGSSARAARLRSLVSEQLPAAPALPGRVAMLLQRLDVRLGELKDWKTFSVAPKRIELIREMESLTGSELPRPELARRIKELQASWRTLARGAAEDLEADGQRFREAAAGALRCARWGSAGSSRRGVRPEHQREADTDRASRAIAERARHARQHRAGEDPATAVASRRPRAAGRREHAVDGIPAAMRCGIRAAGAGIGRIPRGS